MPMADWVSETTAFGFVILMKGNVRNMGTKPQTRPRFEASAKRAKPLPLHGISRENPPHTEYKEHMLTGRVELETTQGGAVQMRTIIGFENGGTNLGHLFHFAVDQFSVAGALPLAQHI
ncbi:hypothetical protein LXL04_030095 [Taraxacum kok-saghyz]